MDIIAEGVKNVTNPLHEEDILVFKLRKEGVKVPSINVGDPAVYFKTPKYIVDAYIEALKQNKTSYTSFLGVPELREAIVNRYKRIYNIDFTEDDVLVTQGVSEALMLLNGALIDKGDSAIFFKPYYPAYLSYFSLFRGTPAYCNYDEENGWNVDTDQLEKRLKEESKGKKSKYMIITNPNNPTGTVLSEKVLKRIVELAKDYGIFLISDEIYDEIIFNNAKFTSISTLAKGIPHLIFNGASKVYDSTGFRIGYAIFPESDKTSQEVKLKMRDISSMRLCPNTPAQYAFAEALNNVKEHEKEVKSMASEIQDRANFATSIINKSEYMHAVEPNGAFYILPKLNMEKLTIKDDREFIHDLLVEEHVQTARGSAFGMPDHLRIVALAPRDTLGEALGKIENLCKRHSK